MPYKVTAYPCHSYDLNPLKDLLYEFLKGFERDFSGQKILVKPNFVTFRQAYLSCTHPLVLRAVCECLLDMGARPFIADSPAFGTAKRVARASGAEKALSEIGVPITKFRHKKKVLLPCGIKVSLAHEALSAYAIVNVPRFKVHNQLLLTLAVKNLFGCVVGVEKAWLHTRLGEKDNLFARMICEVATMLPVQVNILDAVVAMEGRGPTGGRPKKLGMIVAAQNAFALDTAIYERLGLSIQDVPLWKAAQDLSIPAAFPQNIEVKGLPAAFSIELPQSLSPISFQPLRLIKSFTKRLFTRLF
ncbi:DUF362 domain-containing protein [Thermodesulfatator atlanticus]